MCVFVSLDVKPVSSAMYYVRSLISNFKKAAGPVLYLYKTVWPNAPELEGIHATGGHVF